MIWLIGVVFILQTFFYWILKPLILTVTPIFELRGLLFLILFLGIWLISGRVNRYGSP